MNQKPFITKDTVVSKKFSIEKSKLSILNNSKLYDQLPVPKRIEQTINAGVVGLNLIRDVKILQDWEYCVAKAASNNEVKKTIRLFDQGALIWALENNEFSEEDIEQDDSWNDSSITCGAIKDPSLFVNKIAMADGNIFHFAGNPRKPWDGWTSCLKFEKLNNLWLSKNIQFYFFCWDKYEYPQIIENKYKTRLCLQRLTDSPTRLTNEKILLSDNFEQFITQDFIGFTSGWWLKNNEFKLNNLSLAQIEKNNIYTTEVFNQNWAEELEKKYPGYLALVKELEVLTKMSADNPTIDTTSFLAHKDVIRDYQLFWKSTYLFLYSNYGKKLAPTKHGNNWSGLIPSTLSMLYFSHNFNKYRIRKF